MSNRIACIACISLGCAASLVLSASAQQVEKATSTTTCNSSTRGTIGCPNYTAPAATAVPGASMDGSMKVPAGTSTVLLLFKGAVPPNAFMVRVFQGAGAIAS